MLTYNQIIKISRSFQQAHQVLKNFGNGGTWDQVVHNQQPTYKYPLMWMDDLPASVSEGSEIYAFRVSFMAPVNVLKNQESDLMSTNVNEVKSDMIQCANNFIAYWSGQTDQLPDLVLERSVQRTTFEDVTDDKLTGCYIDIRFRQNFDYDVCNLPMGTPTPQPDSCAPVLIYEDGVLVDTVASGGIYSYSSGGGVAEQTFNGSAITDQVAGTTKAIVVRNSNLDPVGFPAVDTATNLTVNVGNSEVEINDSAGSNLYTVSVASEGADVQMITDSTVLVKNSAGTTLYTKTVKAQGSANQIVADTAVSNSDDTYTSVVVAGVPKELPDITVTQPNGDTSAYPSVKNFACTLIAALLNADLISDLTAAQITAVFGARHTTNVITKTTVGADSYSKPANLLFVDVICIGGGGGGASGARKGPGVLTGGGGGGSTGAVTRKRFLASDLAATETLAIGAGGTGGAANSVDDTDQNPGLVGGTTSFGTLVVAIGGNPGVLNAAGATTNRLLSEPSQANLQDMGGIGANGGASGVGANGVVMSNISYGINYGGGGGGGLNAANTQVNGGNQPRIYNSADALNAAAGAGTAGGGNGGDGSANYALQVWLDNTDAPIGYGLSGGGGGSANAAAGGRGGDGGLYGAAGGGGGASRNGNLSGRGGHGSQGAIIIVEHLAV